MGQYIRLWMVVWQALTASKKALGNDMPQQDTLDDALTTIGKRLDQAVEKLTMITQKAKRPQPSVISGWLSVKSGKGFHL